MNRMCCCMLVNLLYKSYDFMYLINRKLIFMLFEEKMCVCASLSKRSFNSVNRVSSERRYYMQKESHINQPLREKGYMPEKAAKDVTKSKETCLNARITFRSTYDIVEIPLSYVNKFTTLNSSLSLENIARFYHLCACTHFFSLVS